MCVPVIDLITIFTTNNLIRPRWFISLILLDKPSYIHIKEKFVFMWCISFYRLPCIAWQRQSPLCILIWSFTSLWRGIKARLKSERRWDCWERLHKITEREFSFFSESEYIFLPPNAMTAKQSRTNVWRISKARRTSDTDSHIHTQIWIIKIEQKGSAWRSECKWEDHMNTLGPEFSLKF